MAVDDAQRDRWLALWQQAADWTLTWRKAYNVRFDRRNMLGAGQFKTVGGDFASSNNSHLHIYGCNCLGALRRLSKITGNDYYHQRARSILLSQSMHVQVTECGMDNEGCAPGNLYL